MLLDFPTVADAAATVAGVVAAGVVPAAMELLDRRILEVIEPYVHAGYPTDADAVLLVEVDGLPGGVAAEAAVIERVARRHRVGSIQVARDEAQRARLWKGRKSALGAVSRIAPHYYLHDTVVPRGRLTEVLARVYETTGRYDLSVVNMFHAGDEAGGVLSGEHGIGLEKRDLMPLLFGRDRGSDRSRLPRRGRRGRCRRKGRRAPAAAGRRAHPPGQGQPEPGGRGAGADRPRPPGGLPRRGDARGGRGRHALRPARPGAGRAGPGVAGRRARARDGRRRDRGGAWRWDPSATWSWRSSWSPATAAGSARAAARSRTSAATTSAGWSRARSAPSG